MDKCHKSNFYLGTALFPSIHLLNNDPVSSNVRVV